jgi:hypothetical protein
MWTMTTIGARTRRRCSSWAPFSARGTCTTRALCFVHIHLRTRTHAHTQHTQHTQHMQHTLMARHTLNRAYGQVLEAQYISTNYVPAPFPQDYYYVLIIVSFTNTRVRVRSPQLMALKIIPMLTAGKNVEDVSREINVLRRCRHPNIVSYYGSATTASELWVLSLFLFIPRRTQHSNTSVRVVRSCVWVCVCACVCACAAVCACRAVVCVCVRRL